MVLYILKGEEPTEKVGRQKKILHNFFEGFKILIKPITGLQADAIFTHSRKEKAWESIS